MIIVSRLLLRFFSSAIIFSLSFFLTLLFTPPSHLSNSKFTTRRMCRRISRPPTSVHLHRARWDRVIILGKRIGGSLCSLRIEQLRTRCEVGGSWKNMEQATGKMVKKNRWKFRGQKGRLCFAADCSFSFFTPPPFRNNFPFSRFRNLDGLECFTLRLQSLRISYLHVSIWFSSRHE